MPLLSLSRFFLIQQLIYRIKIENRIVCLATSVSDTSLPRNLHLPGLKKKHFSYIRTHILFWIRFRYLISQNQITFGDQSLIIEIKNYLYWTAWKIILHMGRIQAKQGFGLGENGAAAGKFCYLYPNSCLKTVFPAVRLIRNCYLHYDINIFLEN